MLLRQHLGADLDEIPDIPGDKFILAVAGVEVPVVFKIPQGEKLCFALVNIVIHIDIGQNHAGSGFDSHPAAYFQGIRLQQDIGRKAIAAEQLFLDRKSVV